LSNLFRWRRDPSTGEEYVETSLSGRLLLEHPLLNKGSAFTEAERHALGLVGLLPPGISTLGLQLERIYGNYRSKTSNLERYIHLVSLQDRNETAFYRLIADHLTEMMPIIYTPVVGEACQAYSRIYRRPRGLYVSYAERAQLDDVLGNLGDQEVEIMVATDGERILGLGDLGIGGMGIPIGKLALYTVCAGIHPSTTVPIMLDVGTDNEALLADPLYLGWRHRRIRGREYDDFIEALIVAVTKRYPNVLLQWEDFAKQNAARLLERYRDRLCTFNDDIQGTGAVTLAAALAASYATGSRLRDQRIVMLGAGSAASGIAGQLVTAIESEGLASAAAGTAIWLVDSQGLVHDGRSDLDAAKRKYAQPASRIASWGIADLQRIQLLDVVRHVRPTMLIGTAAQPGAFSEAIVREMARHVSRPIVFPLSNPTSRCEALPADLIAWTEGRALIATGSPFEDVEYAGHRFPIAQCNNAYIFPGVGLGVIAAGARRITDSMFVAAARALSARVRATAPEALLPPLSQVRDVSRHVALAVASEAQRLGLALARGEEDLARRIEAKMWKPEYVAYRRVMT
jgi:malate dehydrogenase (oxaloacetate-decarboxylating)